MDDLFFHEREQVVLIVKDTIRKLYSMGRELRSEIRNGDTKPNKDRLAKVNAALDYWQRVEQAINGEAAYQEEVKEKLTSLLERAIEICAVEK